MMRTMRDGNGQRERTRLARREALRPAISWNMAAWDFVGMAEAADQEGGWQHRVDDDEEEWMGFDD